MKYYAVKWGTVTRFCHEKVADPESAKRYCFGMATPDMQVIDLGTRKIEALKKLRRIQS